MKNKTLRTTHQVLKDIEKGISRGYTKESLTDIYQLIAQLKGVEACIVKKDTRRALEIINPSRECKLLSLAS